MAEALARAPVQRAIQSLYSHLAPAVAKFNDVVAARGEGSWVWTTEGRKLLDMTSGIGVTSTGHCHPRVVAAIQDQAAKFIHAQQNIFGAHEPMVELVDRLLRVTPSHLSRFFFCNSGAEAVENAVKIARAHTGRQNIIVVEGGYHGRSIGTMALTTSKTIYRQFFGPLMPGVNVAPYPYCLHCKARQLSGNTDWYRLEPDCAPFSSERGCCNSPLESLEMMLHTHTHPRETAAVLLEPILGEGGFLTPPPGYLAALRRICDAHGILLIADEVQSGVGRSGRWWAHTEDPGMLPDILIFAKGIASGFPFAGVATRDALFDGIAPGSMGGTYGGNALGCAAAVATLDAIEEEGMLENTRQRGAQLMQGLLSLAAKHGIADVRGRGLMVAAEFLGSDSTSPKGLAAAITRAASRHGMLLLTAGARETVRFLPALNISEREIDIALETFDQACTDARAELKL